MPPLLPLPGTAPALPRRHWLQQAAAWPMAALAGCAAPWPEVPPGPGSPSARARLDDSAQAHGLAAFRRLKDVSLGLSPLARGRPRPDDGPGALQWRCLPARQLVAWHDSSLPQPQQGWRQAVAGGLPESGEVRLWSAGQAVIDADRLVEAARQADLLALLLLGPLLLAGTDRPVNWAEPTTLDGLRCDQLTLDLRPGLGGQGGSRLALFIDRDQGLLRRLRVLSDAEQGRPGAQAATWDLAQPLAWQGMVWPRRCQRVAPPLPGMAASADGWLLQGLALDRGLLPADLDGPRFSARAAVPATALPPA